MVATKAAAQTGAPEAATQAAAPEAAMWVVASVAGTRAAARGAATRVEAARQSRTLSVRELVTPRVLAVAPPRPLMPRAQTDSRLEIIMPVFCCYYSFFNSQILLLLFLHFSAIILKLLFLKSQFSNTYNE